jgi:hypothetical protein
MTSPLLVGTVPAKAQSLKMAQGVERSGWTALTFATAHGQPITSAGRFSLLGPRGSRTFDQCSNQTQEFLLLRSVASRDEKGSNLNIGDLAT